MKLSPIRFWFSAIIIPCRSTIFHIFFCWNKISFNSKLKWSGMLCLWKMPAVKTVRLCTRSFFSFPLAKKPSLFSCIQSKCKFINIFRLISVHKLLRSMIKYERMTQIFQKSEQMVFGDFVTIPFGLKSEGIFKGSLTVF